MNRLLYPDGRIESGGKVTTPQSRLTFGAFLMSQQRWDQGHHRKRKERQNKV